MTWQINATHAGITITDSTGAEFAVVQNWRAAVEAVCREVERLRSEMKTLKESEMSE